MQLFILNPNPKESAKILQSASPKRSFSQLKEGLQMIACHPVYGQKALIKKDGKPYSTYWIKHPVTKWVIAEDDNFWWTVEYMEALTLFFQNSALNKTLSEWRTFFPMHEWWHIPKFEYFGSWPSPGNSVYEKYQNYLKSKVSNGD